MTISEDADPRTPIGIADEMRNGLDAFISTVVMSVCLHVLLTLIGADLRLIEYVKGLKFRDVDATGAIFRYAHLRDVDFSGANLSGADFFRAVGLSTEQLAFACGDDKTRLPEGVMIARCVRTQ
jgi:hypothetical protein